jgi:hypothetical protein
MESIGNQINIIIDVLKTQDTTLITNTINSINPIIIMYYKMMDASINSYINTKSLEEYFNFDDDEVIDILNEINDINFVIYLINELINCIFPKGKLDSFNKTYYIPLETKNKKINYLISNMNKHYIETNELDNLKTMIDNKYFFDDDYIDNCIYNNNLEALRMLLMDPSNHTGNFKNIFDFSVSSFNANICSLIMETGDMLEFIQLFHDFSKKFPDLGEFDFDIVFNSALVYGRNKCINYVLNNSSINYFFDKYCDPDDDNIDQVIYNFYFHDTIISAIMGKNMNNVETVFNMFINEPNVINNWEIYIKFAAIYGTLDIIKYMITIKPHLVELIDNFYNNILQFALCQGNLDIVKFAIDNGAIYSTNMIEFAEEYNDSRNEDNADIFRYDASGYFDVLFEFSENINENIEECMTFIIKNY